MSKNGGFLDVVWDDLISRRGLSLRPHPGQIVLGGFAIDRRENYIEMEAILQDHTCSCWQCHPEEIPDKIEGTGTISIRREGLLVPRFWKTILNGLPCGFVKEAHPGSDGYVWLARTPPHACACKSGYTCTMILKGNVTVEPDGDEYE